MESKPLLWTSQGAVRQRGAWSALVILSGILLMWGSAGAVVALPKELNPGMDALVERYVPTEDVQRLVGGLIDHGEDVDTVRSILDVVRQAIDEGLPARPLMEKAFEGLTKGVEPRLLKDALLRVRDRYRTAYRHVGTTSSMEERRRTGDAIADALAAGMTIEGIDGIVKAARETASPLSSAGGSVETTVQLVKVSRNLAAMGMSPFWVEKLLVRSMQAGFSSADIQALPDLLLKFTPSAAYDAIAARLVERFGAGAGKATVPLASLVQGMARNRDGADEATLESAADRQMGAGGEKGQGAGSGGPGGGSGSGGGGGGGSGGGGGGGGGGGR